MSLEEVEELQRKQLNALREQEAMLAREKALKEGTVKFHYDSQREKVEAKRKASPGKRKMGALRTRKQTDLFGVQVSSAIPFCIGKKEAERKPKRPAPKRQPSPPEGSVKVFLTLIIFREVLVTYINPFSFKRAVFASASCENL